MENEVKNEEGKNIPEQIKVIREEFEKQLAQQKEEFEKTMVQLKQSHVDEIRALAMGHTIPNTDSNNNDNDDEDEEDKMVARITEKLKKRYR